MRSKAGDEIANVAGAPLVQLDYQQILTAQLATATALVVPPGTLEALIQCSGGLVRWRADDNNPTASQGNRLADEDGMTIRGARALEAIKFIASSGSPVLDIAYWG